jgi:hypothetical protein
MSAFTPYLPLLRCLASSPKPALRRLGSYTLCSLESRFSGCIPDSLFQKPPGGRNRLYTPTLTFWCLLWQMLQGDASGREVVRQVQAIAARSRCRTICSGTAGYFRARQRLSNEQMHVALRTSAAAAARKAASCHGPLQARRVVVIDGTTSVLADTPANRRAFPSVQSRPPNFPLLRIAVLFCLASGAIFAMATGTMRQSELALAGILFNQLSAGDILVGDRQFGCYPILALARQQGIDFIGRTTRRIDARGRIKRLGHQDWLLVWHGKPTQTKWLTKQQQHQRPDSLTVRAVRARLQRRGMRVREIIVITTLLDPVRYPAKEILQAYMQRWRLEMCLDDLKTTLKLESLRGRSPATLHCELLAGLIAHNLVRWTMACAARDYLVQLDTLSFKGTLDASRQFLIAMSTTRCSVTRKRIWLTLLKSISADTVPKRPGRREPRAIKRVKTKYQRMTHPNRAIRDRPKRNKRRTLARLRLGNLM